MFILIKERLKNFRSKISRSKWAARLLDLPCEPAVRSLPGLVMLQIDGLSYRQFEQALKTNRLPFIRRLIKNGTHSRRPFYSGVPSTTPAVQGELFFGQKSAVPAFEFFDRRKGERHTMIYPRSAEYVARTLADCGEPLLAGGRSYSNIYSAGAAEARYCVESMNLESLIKSANPLKFLIVLILYFTKGIRIMGYALLEVGLGVADFARGIAEKRNFFKELKFIPTRVFICIILRELIRFRVILDVGKGIRIIHANLVGYDEQSHRRGPDSKFAHWTLRGIDNVIGDIQRAASNCKCRDYRLIIYSDHGQEKVMDYEDRFGKPVQQCIREVLADGMTAFTGPKRAAPGSGRSFPAVRSQWHYLTKKLDHADGVDAGDVQITQMGPLGHVYLPSRVAAGDLETLAENLVDQAGIPLVLFIKNDRVRAVTVKGGFDLWNQKEKILGEDHPFLQWAADDLEKTVRHPYAGDMVISGWNSVGTPITFAVENGAHGGPGREETRGFVLLPNELNSPAEAIRPLDLRELAIRLLDGDSPRGQTGSLNESGNFSLRVMSYNIHSCINIRGKSVPDDIIDIMARFSPDIAALQEVDVRKERSERIDQAGLIAQRLGMTHQFFPLVREGAEEYGLAILSRYPFEKVKFAPLAAEVLQSRSEPRGAMWVKVMTPMGAVNFVNTHLGLTAKERFAQIRALFGKEWGLGIPENQPLIFCGDLNAGIRSLVYRKISACLSDVQQQVKQPGYPRATFVSMYPVLRIDHIFISRHLHPVFVEVPASLKVRTASDHLPVFAELRLVKECQRIS